MRMQLAVKHISLLVASVLLSVATSISQDDPKVDLEDIEVTFLTSYYEQDGIHSPVTGGQGTELLTNLAPSLNVKIPIDSSRTMTFDGGVDFYSSASSDNIDNPYLDPAHVSGASAHDERSYVTFSYKIKNKNLEYGLYLGTSFEWDVFSYSGGASLALNSEDKNRSVEVSSKYFFDDWKLIYPIEFRVGEQTFLDTDKRHSLNNSILFSANLTKRVSASLTGDFVLQNGLAFYSISQGFIFRVRKRQQLNAYLEQELNTQLVLE